MKDSFEITSGENSALLKLDGAQLSSLKKDGREYLWQGDPAYWSGQAPVCFPIVGVLPGNKMTAFGKECHMKRHGIARINPFDVLSYHKNSISFAQKSSEITKKDFPFDYELKISYTLVESTVSCEYEITNTGSYKLPFVIGAHPAFNCPIDSDEAFEDYKIIFDKAINAPCMRPDHQTGLVDVSKKYAVMRGENVLPLIHNLFEENDALIFENCVSKSVTLCGKNGRGVRLDFQDMNNLLIWSAVGNAPFVALEPWTGISSCSDEDGVFEHKRGMTVLEPDEKAVFKYKITLI